MFMTHNATSDFTVGELSPCALLASGVADNSHCDDNDGGSGGGGGTMPVNQFIRWLVACSVYYFLST